MPRQLHKHSSISLMGGSEENLLCCILHRISPSNCGLSLFLKKHASMILLGIFVSRSLSQGVASVSSLVSFATIYWLCVSTCKIETAELFLWLLIILHPSLSAHSFLYTLS